MAEITKIVNGQEISGMFPVQTLDPNQYGVYKCADSFTYSGTPLELPITNKESGGLSEPKNNKIKLQSGLYVLRIPNYYVAPGTVPGNFIATIEDGQGTTQLAIGSIYHPINNNTVNINLVFLLETECEIRIVLWLDAQTTYTLSGNPIGKMILIKLDQPRLSSLAGNAGNVDTVNFLEPDAATKNVQITHVYDTEEHWLNGYTRIDNNGNEHYEPPKSEVLKRDGAEIIKLWEYPEFPTINYQLRMKHPIVRTLVASITGAYPINSVEVAWTADEDCYVTVHYICNMIGDLHIAIFIDGVPIYNTWLTFHTAMNDVNDFGLIQLKKGQRISASSGGATVDQPVRTTNIYKIASEYAPANAGY